MTWKHLGLSVAWVAALTTTVLTQNLDADLQRAKQREATIGDCKSVLPEYERIAKLGLKAERAVAAEALLRTGMCHEQISSGLEEKMFERIVREFSDVPAIATEAGRRLKKPTAPVVHRPSRHLSWRLSTGGMYVYGQISTNGRYIPFSAKMQGLDQLFVRDLATGGDRQVTSTPIGGVGAFPWDGAAAISFDAKQLAFSWDTRGNAGPSYLQEIRIIDLATQGIPAVKTVFVGDSGAMLYPHAWTPDGKFIAMEILRRDTLEVGVLSIRDGSFRVLRTLQPNGRPGNGASAFISPDGRHLAIDYLTRGKPGRDILVIDISTGADAATIAQPADDVLIGWTADGTNILFASDRGSAWALWSAAFSSGAVFGEPRLLARDIGSVDIALGVTSTGEIWTLKKNRESSEVTVATIDLMTGELVAPPVEAAPDYVGTNSRPAWSPDGAKLAYLSTRGTVYVPRVVLVIQTVGTKSVNELKLEISDVAPGRQTPLLWTPDGQRIVLLATGKTGSGFHSIDIRTGETSLLVPGRFAGGSPETLRLPFGRRSISRDGTFLYYQRGVRPAAIYERHLRSGVERIICGGSVGDLSSDGALAYCVRADAGSTGASTGSVIVEHGLRTAHTREFVAPDTPTSMRLSPDDRTLVVTGQNGTFALSLPTGSEFRKLSAPVGSLRAWAPDGQAVLIGASEAIWWVPMDGRPSKSLQRLGAGSLDVHPDGRQVVQSPTMPRGSDEVWVLRGVLPTPKGGGR